MNAEPGNAPDLRFRVATDADRQRLISLVNSAFSIETFLEGNRTDDERLAAMMQNVSILLAEDGSGQLLACVYTEVRGPRGYLGQLAVDPAHQGKGLGRIMVEAAEERLYKNSLM
jgi:ribosomal protein S18 acetylase RimI-like enzyme